MKHDIGAGQNGAQRCMIMLHLEAVVHEDRPPRLPVRPNFSNSLIASTDMGNPDSWDGGGAGQVQGHDNFLCRPPFSRMPRSSPTDVNRVFNRSENLHGVRERDPHTPCQGDANKGPECKRADAEASLADAEGTASHVAGAPSLQRGNLLGTHVPL